MDIELKEPTLKDEDNCKAFLKEFLMMSSKINGCGGLDSPASYKDWLNTLAKNKSLPFLGYDVDAKVPSITLLAYRKHDKRLVGMVNIRKYLNSSLDYDFTGNIGYCVRPTERQKGYATEITRLALAFCKEQLNLPFVRLGCYFDNVGSRKIIEKFGGKLIQQSPDDFIAKGVYYEISLV